MILRNPSLYRSHHSSKNSWAKRLIVQIIVALCLSFLAGTSFATGSEYKLKAAYLYQFTKFTQWPSQQFSNDQDPIIICVLGRNPFGSSLDSFSSRTSQNRKLIIKYVSSIESISTCHLVFISKSEENRLKQILQRIGSSPILSVSDMENFARRGGIIGFVPKRRKVGIEININASNIAGAKISSKLLSVATIVKSSEGDTP